MHACSENTQKSGAGVEGGGMTAMSLTEKALHRYGGFYLGGRPIKMNKKEFRSSARNQRTII